MPMPKLKLSVTLLLNKGTRLQVKDGQKIKAQTTIAEWDPFAMSILCEMPGIIQFGDILQGVTMEEKVDEVTGLISRVIIESKDPDARPRISIKDAKDKVQNNFGNPG